MRHRHIGSVVTLIVVLGVAGAIAFSLWRSTQPRRDANEVPVQTVGEMQRVGQNAVFVEDQPSGSYGVTVGFVVMREPGFVEIWENKDGMPGEVVGRSELISSGSIEHAVVALERPLVDREVYYAILVREDGTQVADAEGNVILMTFVARADAMPETEPVLP